MLNKIKNKEQAQQYLNGMKGIKNKIIDKVSDVMSYPARRKAQKSMIESDKRFTELKAKNTAKAMQQKALESTFKPANMKGFKYGVGVGK